MAAGVRVPALDGGTVDPLADRGAKAVILVFTRSDCPISQRYAPEIERFRTLFEPFSMRFWLVFVDPNEPEEAIRRTVKDYGQRSGVLLDRHHDLVKLAGPVVTPEAAVYVDGTLVYRGRIDDRYVAFGKARSSPTVRDLEQVLNDIAAGRAVTPRTTHAIGCFIEDLK